MAAPSLISSRRSPKPRRIAVLSIHTSPLDQPGTGDAGGMNVYIVETARRLAESGIEVEIFTRATSSFLPRSVEMAPGVVVHHVTAGPFEGLLKQDLPGQLCAVSAGVMRAEAARPEGWFDLIHSHYWLSGQVGWLASERWNVPLVHSMHTMAKVKNRDLAEGDTAEPAMRVIGEQQVVAAADRLVANTDDEAHELVDLYGARPDAVDVVHPGVDLDLFTPGSMREARRRRGIADDAVLLLFVGRIQPLKAPDVLVRAAAELLARDPALRSRLVVAICGGPSGSGLAQPTSLIDLARELGVADVVRFEPPSDRATLVDWYRAADVAVVPSHSESFGLVAVEAQACGTPVVAAAVGGLRTAVADHVSGLLVSGHDPRDFATAIASITEPAPTAPRDVRRGPHARRRLRLGRHHRRPHDQLLGRPREPRSRPAGLGPPLMTTAAAEAAVREFLAESGLDWEPGGPGTFVVTIPGVTKLRTTAALTVGEHALTVNAFIARNPDENHEAVYRWLLERNQRMYAVAFAVDHLGDIYLVGRLPLAAVTVDELDRIVGAVLEYADGSFNTILELGFASAIRREWQWRT